ncbi:hypothetical protein [Candidatus Poriferisodalis sp.]|uniref:hypothetical protein n=1 Tax=Candidatus Poriferisodalis sp. TaxID=3101277 RepID=UPI003B020FA7
MAVPRVVGGRQLSIDAGPDDARSDDGRGAGFLVLTSAAPLPPDAAPFLYRNRPEAGRPMFHD